jgi:hypothetical protein
MSEPKRIDYANDDDFIDAMAKHYGIDPRMCRPLSKVEYLMAENVRLKVSLHNVDALVVKMSDKISSLKAQIELLSKAGDQFARDMVQEYGLKRCLDEDVYNNWIAAKKGGHPNE